MKFSPTTHLLPKNANPQNANPASNQPVAGGLLSLPPFPASQQTKSKHWRIFHQAFPLLNPVSQAHHGVPCTVPGAGWHLPTVPECHHRGALMSLGTAAVTSGATLSQRGSDICPPCQFTVPHFPLDLFLPRDKNTTWWEGNLLDTHS